MTERPFLELFRDKVFGRRKTVLLYPTKLRVEELIDRQENLHISPVRLKPGASRLINNLEMTVRKTPGDSGMAEIKLREINHFPRGLRKLSINDITIDRGVIRIGDDILIINRGTSRAGRRKLVIARPEEVDVHSQKHRLARQKQLHPLTA